MNEFTISSIETASSKNALRSAVNTLTSIGFAVTARNSTSATLSGPGLNSSRQNPLLGASIVNLEVGDRSLHLNAELGGVERMKRFLYRFPFLLGLSLGLFFAVVGGFIFGQQFGVGFGVPGAPGWRWFMLAVCAAMLPVTPWLFLSPMMARMIRRRTQQALTTLVNNSAFAANADM